MGADSTLTIVIPVFNRDKLLARCLDSIASQSVDNVSVIVVDDGSTDASADIARSHPLRPVVLQGDHRGATAARNTGLDAVATPWTMFFDSDDIMEPGHLEVALNATKDNVDIVGWDVTLQRFDGSTRILPFETRDIHWHNIMHGTMGTQRYMARTDLFRKAGRWNTEAPIWNDIELGARMLVLNPRVVKVPGRHVRQIQSRQSITGTSWAANHDKYVATLGILSDTVGRLHPDWIALKQAILAADMAREKSPFGRSLYDAVHTDRLSARQRLAVRLAYRYRRLGGRGAARLLRPLLS